MTDRYAPGDFYQIPKELHKAVKSPYTFAVLCYLIQYTDDHGHCFPGQETLTQGFMCRKQVRRAATELEYKGIISITKMWHKGGGINLAYDVNFDRLIQLIKDSPRELQSNGHTVQQTDSALEVQGNVGPTQGNVSPTQGNVSPNNEIQLTKSNGRDPFNENQGLPAEGKKLETSRLKKNKCVKKEVTRDQARIIFLSYRTTPKYSAVDFELSLKKYLGYWFDSGKKLKLPNKAAQNWLNNEIDGKFSSHFRAAPPKADPVADAEAEKIANELNAEEIKNG